MMGLFILGGYMYYVFSHGDDGELVQVSTMFSQYEDALRFKCKYEEWKNSSAYVFKDVSEGQHT